MARGIHAADSGPRGVPGRAGVIVVGNGLFKPNISTMVGKLYGAGRPAARFRLHDLLHGDQRRALAAPVLCAAVSHYMFPIEVTAGTVGADGVVVPDYRWGFGMAGAGMLLGLVTFLIGGGLLKGEAARPRIATR
jgi:POT family proton-dependent oligopeptide transporter